MLALWAVNANTARCALRETAPSSAAYTGRRPDWATRLVVPIHESYPLRDVLHAIEDFSKPKLGKLTIAVG